MLYVLNSLLIFSIPLGANQLGVTVASTNKTAATLQQLLPSPAAHAQARPVYFSNWLDGTVEQRQELIATTEHVSDLQAQQALVELGGTAIEFESPREALRVRLAASRTSEQVDQINAAIHKNTGVVELRTRDEIRF